MYRLEQIASCAPAGIILREKELPEAEYRELAQNVLTVCRRYGVPCILHSFVRTAAALQADAVHLPLPLLRNMSAAEKKQFSVIGVSCHSEEEADEAERLGCTYLIAGHIFNTECKKGLPGRGLDFLRRVCAQIKIPVYAIGGISPENADDVRRTGASGLCVMSGLMRCDDPAQFLSRFTISGENGIL